MRGKRRGAWWLAAILAAVLLLAALTASADAAGPAAAPGWGLPSSLASSPSVAHRLIAARLRRAERTALRRHRHAGVAAAKAVRPDITASGFEGEVTDASTKEGVTGIEVCAYEVAALEEGLYEREELEPACGTVLDANGHYAMGVPPGEYFVEFFDPSGNYMPQIYENTASEPPDPVVIVKTKPLTKEINGALTKGGRIEGQVTAAEGGRPLSGITVCAIAFEVAGFGCTETGSEGKYQVGGLPSGKYEIFFVVPEVPGYDYLDEPLEKVAVSAGLTTTGANRALPSGGEVEGTVTAAAGGAAVSGVWACAFPTVAASEEEEEELEHCTRTAADGTYTVERLQPGVYFVEFFGEPVFATQFWNGTTFGAPHLAGAGPLTILPPAPRTGIDATMLRVGEEPPKPAPVVTPPAPQTATPAPPAPTIAVLSTKAVVPALTAEGRVHVSGHRASVKLRCGVGPCKGTIQLTITVVKRVRSHGRTVTRRVTLVVGSGSFSLAQGASATATIHLTSQGARLLASAARHPQAGKLKLVLHGAKTTQRAVVVR
jgi:hypothetical protein